jgi:hypothetical protein
MKAKVKGSLTATLTDMDHALDDIQAGTSAPPSAISMPLVAPGRNVHLTDKQRAKVL